MTNILVVEDNEGLRRLMGIHLRRAGYHILEAADGLEALDIMEHERVHLIVTDVMMPRLDGYALVQELRSAGDKTPILLVTVKDSLEDKRTGFHAGADDYLTKPVDFEELLLRVGALLRRSQIATENRLTIGDVVLDANSLSVTMDGREETLPMKEFQLLFKLLSYPGVIFTRMQLMDEIWGMESDTDDHTVNVHVNRLRDKLRDNGDFEIVTVRGLGYKAEKRA